MSEKQGQRRTKRARRAPRGPRAKGFEPANKGKKYPAELLTDDEIGRLVRACSSRAPSGVRNRAMIILMYRSGLRISEALDLHPKDVDLDEGTLRVLHGKGDKARTLGLDAGTMAALERWMGHRSRLGLNGRHKLFCTLAGGELKAAYVRALLPRLAEKTGIEKRVHAHGLRHAFAAAEARRGVPMNLIQAELGHASLAVTSRYLAHISPQDVIDAMKDREWACPE